MEKWALISVYNKDGIVEFVKELVELGWSIIASGGTAKMLAENGIFVRDTASLVGEAILGHRVVTLSREIHAGLLARDTEEDRKELEQLGIPRIDLVCVDFYPLKEEIDRPGATCESVIEKTDIGGPTMVSSGAKGQRIVVCDPADRQKVVTWLKDGKPNEAEFIQMLCAKADFTVGYYRILSANFHSKGKCADIVKAFGCNWVQHL